MKRFGYLLLLLPGMAMAQSGWLPVSRMVEHPYGALMHDVDQDTHTAVRPWKRKDVAGLDSLRGAALLPWLDRMGGPGTDSRLRGGPLAEALMGASLLEDDPLKHRFSGGLWAAYDPHPRLSIHLDAQAWNEHMPDYLDSLVRNTRVSLGEGYARGGDPAWTHHDWSALVSYDAGKYFNITTGRGRNAFGEGFRSLMLDANTTNYPFLKITTNVWKVRYVNLFAAMSDIRGAGGRPSRFARKYASMHYLSWNALRRLNISFFEAIIWESNDPGYPRGFDLNYLNPVIFYRPTEFQIGSPDNALMGLGVSYKVGRSSKVYGQFVLDEFLLAEVRGGTGWYGNKQALQLGFLSFDAFRVPGLMLRTEMNYVRPFMYGHFDTRQNYAHFGQPLAHPYGSNFIEGIIQGEWRSGNWHFRELFSVAWMGTDSVDSYGNDIFRSETERPARDADGRRRNYRYYLGGHSPVTIIYNELRAGWVIDPATGLSLEAGWILRARAPERGETLITNFVQLGLACHFRERDRMQEMRYSLP
jgi:hypothetical protein